MFLFLNYNKDFVEFVKEKGFLFKRKLGKGGFCMIFL